MSASHQAEEHVGEWKLSIWADSLDEIFAEAIRVLADECGEPAGEPSEWEEVSVRARDNATLLVDFLNEIIGRSEIEERAYFDIDRMRIRDGMLTARLRGASVKTWTSPLKAATYHGLELEQEGGRWKAIVLFDV